jgi:hypothetical protein
MRWKCDYGHLDELKNNPFPIFPSRRFTYDLFRLGVIFSGASLACSISAHALIEPSAIMSTLELSAMSTGNHINM